MERFLKIIKGITMYVFVCIDGYKIWPAIVRETRVWGVLLKLKAECRRRERSQSA
jgi:hypothetical protein